MRPHRSRSGQDPAPAPHQQPPGYDQESPEAQKPEVPGHWSAEVVTNVVYAQPRDQTFTSWNRNLPTGFTMSVKVPRGLTHSKRLLDPDVWVERLTRAWHELRDRRGALLVQMHPAHQRDDARLDYFLAALPQWMRIAVEFRHQTSHTDDVLAILERHGAAYTVMSGASLPCLLRATAPFVYVRWHGPSDQHLYAGSYPDESLRWWAERIREWLAQDRDVYGYFNNDGDANAVRNARTLRAYLGA